MGKFRLAAICLAALALPALAVPALAQFPRDPAARLEAQRQAMARLAFMDGVWRGPAWTLLPSGRHELVQTERVGLFLGGTVRVVEGRGYEADGRVGFNAFGVISYDPDSATYSIRTWAMGHGASHVLRVTDGGVVWELPAGPGTVIRHSATIRDGTWHEVSERIVRGGAPVRVAELTLRRIGDTAWPAAAPVPVR